MVNVLRMKSVEYRLIFALDGPPADVAPAKTFFPVNQVNRHIGLIVRGLDARAERRNAENASAIGDQIIAVERRSGVEYLNIMQG